MNLFESVRRRPLIWILSLVAILISVAVVVLFALSSLPVSVDSISLDRSELTFYSFSQTHQLSPVTEPAGVSPRRLTWTSSDPSVATVSSSGFVTPVGNGVALITVYGEKGNGIAHCTVNVSVVSSITFAQEEVVLPIHRSQQLQYTVEPSEIDVGRLVWSSSDSSVVSVDGNGVITAHRGGTATVTLAVADGSVSHSCKVTVTENVPIQGVSFAVTEFVFDSFDDTLILTPIFTPEDTSQRDLAWLSTSPDVATVNPETGEVTPVANGTTTIIVQSVHGDFTASCTVVVDRSIPVKGISLSVDSYKFKGVNQTYLIRPVFDPVDASNQKIKWTSSDPSVAKVSDQGLVTALKKGTATVKLTTEDGGYTAEFKVTVEPDSKIAVTGIKLSSYTATLEKGKTVKISASVQPSNATEKGITYTSKNTAVAKVSASGTVTAVGYGTTQIVVTTKDGNFSENFTVAVPEPPPPETPDPETPDTPVEDPDYVKGVWYSYVDFPGLDNLSADQWKKEIDTLMDNTVQMGLNTVYFHVRPSGDALYPSELYPSSTYVVEDQGDPLPMDLLDYAIKSAHERGLSLHAWINPYRVTTSTTSTKNLASTNPAVKNPSWVLSDGKRLYLNPGIPEVRQYIIDGVMEIVNKYDVDGIHFDDYFYPYDLGDWDDSATYAKYGNGQALDDWRRANNDALIQGVYEAIKAKNKDMLFGVSPAGVWAKKSSALPEGTDNIGNPMQTYNQGYADTRKWVVNGWLDYICPQIYWQIDHKAAPFKPLVDWWNDLVAKTDVKLYIGIAAYKCGGDDAVSAYTSGKEIPAQLDYLETKSDVSGAVFFSYKSLMENYAGVKDQITDRYYKKPVSTTLQFSQPSITVDASYSGVYVVGVSDPNYPLYANGETVSRTSDGYFAHPVSLTGTKTTVKFTHKGQTVDYVITRTSSDTAGSSQYLSSFGFEKNSFSPSFDTADRSGTSVSFSCVAPAGSTVTVKIGTYTIPLTTKTKDPGNGKYLKATYSGSVTLPQTDNNENTTLGYVIFQATRGEESATYSPGCLIEVINEPSSYVMEVTTGGTDVLPNLEVKPTFYYLATEGAKVHVVSKKDGKAKLDNGMYLSLSALKSSVSSFATAKLNGLSVSNTKKNTVFSFKLTDSVFHTVWMDTDFAEITLYNVSGEIPAVSLADNPLFSKMEALRVDDTTVRIHLTYKTSKHIYGYTCYFDGKTLYVNFRNPVTLSSGDKPLTGIVISLDPGHCGTADPGAQRYYNGKLINESSLTWKLSNLVAEKLRALGATVVLSRKENQDSYSLDETIAGFRALNPDLNLSIHFNASEDNSPTATGTEAYWCYGNSQLLSDVVMKTFTEQTGFKYRKSARDYYKVSRLCEFPSVLFETAFISNSKDLAWFMSDSNMEKAASAISDGILDFFKEQNN
ncbi:MAG: family 10 glycosylhydrolase [Clostridia bacterium]|nr:family 10 glycosylhydrolase [Clostridia bacterium]